MNGKTGIRGNYVDIGAREVFPAELMVENGKILSITRLEALSPGIRGFIIPGFVDSHVHIESSMLVPSEFARLAVVHGTVATVSDPHEIANVCGMEGIEYMIGNGKTVPFKFNFGAPSCVPATSFETAGATIDPARVEELLSRKEIKYLSEMMNFPGVLFNDADVMKKIAAAKKMGKPVDGHAPGLRGEKAKQYIDAGISTDHECFTAEEALDKLQFGMKILVREGSAAKNFDALVELLHDHWQNMMFCSDDKHPDSLVIGHINELCSRAVARGVDPFKVLQAACVNPVMHYKLDVGLLRVGDPADFLVVSDLETFKVMQTFIDGQLVAENGKSLVQTSMPGIINNFSCEKTKPSSFKANFQGEQLIDVIEALDGQLITNRLSLSPLVDNGEIVSDVERDILKFVVVNRYFTAPVAIGFIKNVGLKQGALASSVAHDSHNIVAVGVDDDSLSLAINLVIEKKGGVCAVGAGEQMVLALPVAGLMSNEDGYKIAVEYTAIDALSKKMGSTLSSPFMTLSFMALLVIPHLKLSDKGLFDGDRFELLH